MPTPFYREGVVEGARGPEVIVGGRTLTSFASANYLGYEPPCSCRAPMFGARQSLGLPGFLARDADSAMLESELAAWMEQPSALLGKSMFHLLVDLMQTASQDGPVLVSRDSYSLTQLAARVLNPCSVMAFGSPGEARRLVARRRVRPRRSRPTLFVDGWCLRGGLPPVAELAHIAGGAGGRLIVDDTQALGLLGKPARQMGVSGGLPLGAGGTGTVPFVGAPRHHVVTVASFGKSFGLPLAFAVGAEEFIRRLRAGAPLSRAASQAPLGLVRAARHALTWNRTGGDATRARLLRAVEQLRCFGPITGVSYSPVQRWISSRLRLARVRWARLYEQGVWCLLERDGYDGGALTFLVTAAHEGPAVARTLAKLASMERKYAWSSTGTAT